MKNKLHTIIFPFLRGYMYASLGHQFRKTDSICKIIDVSISLNDRKEYQEITRN